jgi:Ca-activated chloride channel family protein
MKIVINPLRPSLCADAQDFHALVRLQSEPVPDFKPTPLSLVLVVDRSGSMAGAKLNEAKRCVIDLIKRMNPTDQIGLVQYDDQVDVVLPLSTVEQCSSVFEALVRGITPNGCTDLHLGWLCGGEMLAPIAGRDTACHVILLSDGFANRGLTQIQRISEQVAALAEAGVTTTSVGLGLDFNEELMTAMARAGQGNAHYGERAIDLAETFDAEIGRLSQLQWRQVELSLAAGFDRYEVLNAYERSQIGWHMPSVAMGSECWALLRIPMQDAIAIQRDLGTALAIQVGATGSDGERLTFSARLEALPEVDWSDYELQPSHELVQRRINELAAAQLQLRIREAALQGEWHIVEHLLTQLELLGRHEPWVAASIAFARQLMRERDETRMSKEMLYKSNKMQRRLSSMDEGTFSMEDDGGMPAFLRRKATEGRRSER